VKVDNSEGGLERFIQEIRKIYGISEEHEMQLAFDCSDPITGERQQAMPQQWMMLFDLLVHCVRTGCMGRCGGRPVWQELGKAFIAGIGEGLYGRN
jgi:hypothetical protein